MSDKTEKKRESDTKYALKVGAILRKFDTKREPLPVKQAEMRASAIIPDWFDVDSKVHEGIDLTALERFVYDYDIAEPEASDKFRKSLIDVLREAKGLWESEEAADGR